ncbi:MAG: hypothetical protein K2R93_21975 [Gemmatimonadaceae bacterium]|nr:hypothetical protein [Gemmatimonadaceae bacterium]
MHLQRGLRNGLFVLAYAFALAPRTLAAQAFPNFGYAPPADWTLPTFQLSQAYPTSLPAASVYPWLSIDFHAAPAAYLQAVLAYAYDGNVDVDFVVQKNSKRQWFHAPWLHPGANGREFVRGLTRERQSRPYELSATQKTIARNFAVGFFSDRGGYTIGSVWSNPVAPNPAAATFPEGTVAFKLLFTTATSTDVPFLAGSPEWVADINRAHSAKDVLATKVRLLQIDVAVKDKRSSKGGWVFGTFHYDSAVADSNPWRRVRPLALMWGDDPTFLPANYASGQRPAQSWINQSSPLVKYRANPPIGAKPPATLGWAGRANGPVDNPLSSCLSCHGTAQLPADSAMVARGTSDSAKLWWFRNTKPGEAFTSGNASLDFSLQLGVGIQNLQDSLAKSSPSLKAKSRATTPERTLRGDFRFSRGGR